MKITSLLSATALVSCTMLVPGVAWGADTPAKPAAATPADAPQSTAADAPQTTASLDDQNNTKPDGSEIVITGSRIARPTLDSPVPVTSVAVGELSSRGNVILGDTLNELPALRNTFNSGNSTRFIGTAGLNILDLRGLGTSRTLVLVNGRRHVTSSAGDFLVDVNTIPTDLTERIDFVTGGNSAVYGSDAVAGVVNFILKRNFSGLSLKGQGGISSRGDRGSYFVSATAGQNFADGRGNIAVAAEYAKTNALYYTDRDYLTGAYSGRCQFQLTENTVGEPAAGDGIPDNTFLCGIRNGSISDGGTVGSLGGGKYLRFSSTGDLFVDSSTRNFAAAGSGNVQGGEGSTLRNTGQLAAGIDRFDVNLLAHFDLSDAFKPFVEAKYVRIHTNQEGQPSFFTSVPGTLGGPAMRCNNAFLTAQALGTLQSYGLCSNVATGTFPLARFNIDFGGRGELHLRETFRVVAGVEGDFNGDWHYEVSANYGSYVSHNKSLNNLLLFDINGNPAGFNLAVDAVRNTAGQIVCRVNLVTVTAPGCVPINVFGYGQPSQAALDYVNVTATSFERAKEFVAGAYVSGDSSQLFSLPGGPVQFALGVEYRSETAASAFDPLTASGGTFLNAIQPFNPPKFEVKDAYGELRLPILKDMPFAKLLSVEGAGRISKYNSATGTVSAYNISGIYAPVSDFRVRANYSTSVRAPTLSDLYSPFSQNFAQLSDPCDAANINSNPNYVTNCAAAGVPKTFNAAAVAASAGSSCPTAQVAVGLPFLNCPARTSSTGYSSGGNINLREERGKSLTIGGVFTPRFLPGFSMTIDYYRITVKDLIASLGAQTIINLCYGNAGGINNQYCTSIKRDPTTGFFVQPAVLSSGINYASQKTDGIDLDIAYAHRFGNGDRVTFRAIGTYLLTLDNYTDPQNPQVPNRQRSELGSPVIAFNLNASYQHGPLNLSYTLRYTGKQTIGTYEAQNSYIGLCTASLATSIGCTSGQLATLPPQNADQYPQIYYPAMFIHNAKIAFDIDKKKSFYFGVDNIFDTQPPLGLLGTESGSPVNSIGRFFYAGIEFNF